MFSRRRGPRSQKCLGPTKVIMRTWVVNQTTQTKSHISSITRWQEVSSSLLLEIKLSPFSSEFLRKTKKWEQILKFYYLYFFSFRKLLLSKGCLVNKHRYFTLKIVWTEKYSLLYWRVYHSEAMWNMQRSHALDS